MLLNKVCKEFQYSVKKDDCFANIELIHSLSRKFSQKLNVNIMYSKYVNKSIILMEVILQSVSKTKSFYANGKHVQSVDLQVVIS